MKSLTKIEDVTVKHIFALVKAELCDKFENIDVLGFSFDLVIYPKDLTKPIQHIDVVLLAKKHKEKAKLYRYKMAWDCKEKMFIHSEELDCRSLDDED